MGYLIVRDATEYGRAVRTYLSHYPGSSRPWIFSSDRDIAREFSTREEAQRIINKRSNPVGWRVVTTSEDEEHWPETARNAAREHGRKHMLDKARAWVQAEEDRDIRQARLAKLRSRRIEPKAGLK
jgi:hypothetical protein